MADGKPFGNTSGKADEQEVAVTKLKQVREAKGLTLRELAGVVGVSHARVWQLEHGQDAPIELKVRFARALDVPVHRLFPSREPEGVG
jgi:transcriptional regulator with XRE-family HTH domain